MQSSRILCFTTVQNNKGVQVKERAVLPEEYWHPFPVIDREGGLEWEENMSVEFLFEGREGNITTSEYPKTLLVNEFAEL